MQDDYSDDDYSYTYSDEDDEDEVNSQMSGAASMELDDSVSPLAKNLPDSASRRKGNRGSSYGMGRGFASMTESDSSLVRMTSSNELSSVLNDRINEVSELFNLRSSVAHVLLRHFRWNKERFFELYTSNPEKVVKDAGVAARCKICPPDTSSSTDERPLQRTGVMTRQRQAAQKRSCAICMEDDYQPSDMIQMPCKHEFCRFCWKNFISTMIQDGPTCIHKTCPQVRCNEIVTEEEVCKIAPEFESQYRSYQLRSFVELNGTSRWCPGPGCERVACLCADSASLFFTDSTIIATCDYCPTSFCLKCGEEPHAPLGCKDLSKWYEKCKNESETANWILANTKACPKCSSRIEKNQGCNHMTCQQCKYEFCWICMGNWVEHSATTGGYYRCNKFESDDGGANIGNESDAAKAKRELDRYLHYYKRYHAHADAQKFASKQLKETEERMMLLQESSNNSTWTDVEFLKTANEQLVECRRVLKYTYCFAFYLPEKSSGLKRQSSTESNSEEKARMESEVKKEQFENHQSMLERFTENLSELVEKPLPEINREDVVNKTRVVNNFMKNILKYVEEGMDTD